jgi:transglutaminase-like putative cysteine protease
MKTKKSFTVLFSALMLIAVVFPCVNASNVTNPTPPGWVGQFDAWAGQKNMSAYNPVVIPVPIRTMNENTAKAYPGVKFIKPGTLISMANGIVDEEHSSMNVAKINFVNPVSKTDSLAKANLVPMVAPEYGYFNWYWTQDTGATQIIVIHNYGGSTASGQVTFVSIEDQYGTSASFSNLAPGENCTVTIPFVVIASQSSVGIKPMGFFITVDPDNTVTWSGQLELNAIEKYNNDASHLPDPDGGDNLETSDLYHFPFNEGYAIVLEAATAADNTSSPYETANRLNTYVHGMMIYAFTDLYSLYAASDIYIEDHGNQGVCDEFATMDISFSRALGIPSRFLGITWVNETGSAIGHGILENRVSGRWVHSDPTWNAFDDPQVYKRGNNTHMNLTKYTDADDNRFSEDPTGDGLLSYKDMVADSFGELPGYN